MNIRPIQADDIAKLWPAGAPASVRAFVAELDGEVLGVAGIAYWPNRIAAFADMKPGGEKYPLTIMRIARRVQALLREVKAPVYCNADPDFPNSPAFLAHVGFEHVGGRTFVWRNK